MNRFKTKIVGLATAVLLSAGALIAPLTASAVTIDELMAQIVALQAQLLVLQGSSASYCGQVLVHSFLDRRVKRR